MPMLSAEGSLEMTLVRRNGSLTRWVEGSCTADAVPAALFEDFRAARWSLKGALTEQVDTLGDLVTGCRTVLDFTISRPGGGFHGQWTEIEALRYLQQINDILARHGLLNVPTRTPQLAHQL